nr:uncharacterized protein LOC105850639 [Hydra vulgaris]
MASRSSRSFRARRKVTINVVGEYKRKVTKNWYGSNNAETQPLKKNKDVDDDEVSTSSSQNYDNNIVIKQSFYKRLQPPYNDITRKKAENWCALKKQAIGLKLQSSSVSLLATRCTDNETGKNTEPLLNIPCCMCDKDDSIDQLIQCPDCSFIWYCRECWEHYHQKLSLFHKARVWCSQVGYFKQYNCAMRVIKSSSCKCVNSLNKELIVFDYSGRQHQSLVAECLCSSNIVDILLEKSFWPSSPVNPSAAFSYELMDLMEALFLDGYVSVKSFCKALYTKSKGDDYIKIDAIYKMVTGECFLSYLLFKNDLKTFKPRFQNFHNLSICPACPKESGTLVLSFDALFGLVRKFSSGKSHYEPVLKNLYLLDQSIVDQFVSNYNCKLSVEELKTCNDFKAINSLRSKKSNAKLDETGVFGCSCRHEVPRQFFNLKSGESLANAVYLINQILDQVKKEVNVVVMYDIACMLVKHLKKRGSNILDKNVSFCIPSFHVYGHRSACQLKYSPKSTVGIGISDGEVMERLWSALRRFSKITKEQTPSHRADTLTLGLLHYAQYSINSLSRRLCARIDKAVQIKDTTDIELEKTLKSIGVLQREVIQSWIATEIDMEDCGNQKNDKESDLECYVLILNDWWKLRKDIETTTSNPDINIELERLERELSIKEKKLKINVRWDPINAFFKDTLATVFERKKNNIMLKMQSFAFQKLFLGNLKKKYADGQKIAIKLTKQLNKNNKSLQDLIKEYNSIVLIYPSKFLKNVVVWDEVGDLESVFWKNYWTQKSSDFAIPVTVKRKCIELFQLNCRAIEEIEMVKSEMKNVINFNQAKINEFKLSHYLKIILKIMGGKQDY